MDPQLEGALLRLPPLERAVLILSDVLRWEAVEVAELLDMRLETLNCALLRARQSLNLT